MHVSAAHPKQFVVRVDSARTCQPAQSSLDSRNTQLERGFHGRGTQLELEGRKGMLIHLMQYAGALPVKPHIRFRCIRTDKVGRDADHTLTTGRRLTWCEP